MSGKMEVFWHKAEVGPFSSTVGASVILTDAAGKHVGQLMLLSFGDAKADFDKAAYLAALQSIVDYLNATPAADVRGCPICGRTRKSEMLEGRAVWHCEHCHEMRPFEEPAADVRGSVGAEVAEMVKHLRNRDAMVLSGVVHCWPAMQQAADLLERLAGEYVRGIEDAAKIADAIEMQQEIDLGAANSGGAGQVAAAIRALAQRPKP